MVTQQFNCYEFSLRKELYRTKKCTFVNLFITTLKIYMNIHIYA